MRARNLIATMLMKTLTEKGIPFHSGYFCGSTYCIGVVVTNIDEAFQLGQQLTDYKGILGVDSTTSNSRKRILAFRDALVSA